MRSCPKSYEEAEDQITQWLTTQQWLWPIKRTMAISKSDSSQTPFRPYPDNECWTGGVVLGVGSASGTHSGTVLDRLLQTWVFLINVDSSRAYSRLYTEHTTLHFNSSSQSTSGLNHFRIQRIVMIHTLQPVGFTGNFNENNNKVVAEF